MRIKHVCQPDDTGCGIACLAMILNLTYNQVKDWMIKNKFLKPGTNDFGTTFQDLYKVLAEHRIKIVRKRKFKQWRNIPAKVAIVSTNYNASGCWHWVVFIRDIEGCFIYDPGKRRKKIRDFRGKVSGQFIEVIL
ncbi:MAG: hypothetical protein EOP00_15225 [Pedobacter sp.]|nr:MAG: hypothetical protein EOP00_15225 [Pedobacter sp.]